MGHVLAQSSKSGAQRVKATQQMLGMGKDLGNRRHIGLPAVSDDDLGMIPAGFELSEKERAVGGGVGRQQGPVERKARDMIDGDKEIPPPPGDLDPLFIPSHSA